MIDNRDPSINKVCTPIKIIFSRGLRIRSHLQDLAFPLLDFCLLT